MRTVRVWPKLLWPSCFSAVMNLAPFFLLPSDQSEEPAQVSSASALICWERDGPCSLGWSSEDQPREHGPSRSQQMSAEARGGRSAARRGDSLTAALPKPTEVICRWSDSYPSSPRAGTQSGRRSRSVARLTSGRSSLCLSAWRCAEISSYTRPFPFNTPTVLEWAGGEVGVAALTRL